MHRTCPKCGQLTSTVEGKSTTEEFCERCGEPIGVLESGPERSSDKIEEPSSETSKKSIRILNIVTIWVVIVVLVCLLFPFIIYSPRSTPRNACYNNQHQITLALFGYENDKGHLPPAYIADKNGKPMHSWRVLILPYLGRKDLYEQYDFNEPWDGPHNRLLADKMPDIYCCPSNTDSPNCTSYAMLVGPHTLNSSPPSRIGLWYVSSHDGLTKTLLLVEAADAKINWLEPRDLNVEEMSYQINKDGKEISSHHPGGAVVSFCDGHQQFLPENIKPETLKAMTTIDGGEPTAPGDDLVQ
jgi:prepilin-type processing-associated H-X9-DG protein